MSILWLSWIDFETAGIGLVATPRPSVHGDITQIDALQVIKQCHKWDKRGRRDDDRGVSPCFWKRVHRTFRTIHLNVKELATISVLSFWHDLCWNSVFLRAKAKRGGKRVPTRTHSTSKGLSIQSVRRLGEKGVGVGIWRLVGGDSKALTGLESEKVFVEVLPKSSSFKKDLIWGPFKVLFEVFNEHLIYRSSLRTQS